MVEIDKPGLLPAIRITEVTVLDCPEDGFEYRGQLSSQNEAGLMLLEQTLQTRRKPEWLVNVRHQGGASVLFALEARRYHTSHWEEVSSVTFQTEKYINGHSSVIAELPLQGWATAAQLQLRIRLSKAQEEQPGSASVVHLNKTIQPAVQQITVASAAEVTITSEELAALPPLTPAEQVIVKDSWNKLLAFQDMLIEMFFERLLHEAPELIYSFGDAIDLVPEYFAALFDVAVRQINPHTERMLRESYKSVYPAPPGGFKTPEAYVALLSDLGMKPKHWVTARRVFTWMLPHIPHLEEYDRENLAKGIHSALYRFFSKHILPIALESIRQYDEAISPDMIRQMRRTGEILVMNARASGIDFYRILFVKHPEVMPYFGRVDVDTLAEHLMQSVAFLSRSLAAGRDAITELRELARLHASSGVASDTYHKIVEPMLSVMKKRVPGFSVKEEAAWQTVLNRVINVLQQPIVNQEIIRAKAKSFIDQLAEELAWEPANHQRRQAEIEREIHATGTYTHTYEELAYGAQLAWRNASKCIGRIAWKNMIVRDLRHVTEPDQMFQECVEHVRMATNGGNVQIVMNVFRPKMPKERWGPRLWNTQYIRFAAYRQKDGTILGDAANLALTQVIIRQGWAPPAKKTAFDVLPLVIEVPGQVPKIYQLPKEEVLKIRIKHPDYPGIGKLGLQWCTIPVISNFKMEIGGVFYSCLPFNGWFMETEIARNLFEEGRYGKAEAIAQAMKLDTSSEQTLWRDEAFLQLNKAVLHSFSKAKVTLVDHQTASRQFLIHDLREKRAGRECPAQWSWVVPPAGGSTTAVWHHEMRDFYLTPQYLYAADKWAVIESNLTIEGEEANAGEPATARIVILYGSETGTAEGYARQAARRLSRFQPQVLSLDEYTFTDLPRQQLVLVITSTFADGDLPANAKAFYSWIQQQPKDIYKGFNFSVMAIGSSVYPQFCAGGATLEREMIRIGGHPVVPMHKGDEIRGQANTFLHWLEMVARLLGEDPTSTKSANNVRLQVQFMKVSEAPEHPEKTYPDYLPGTEVPVVVNRELLKEVIVGSRSTRFLAFDITGTGLSYETGDHVAIYPNNPPALVNRLCDQLGIVPGAWFRTTLVDGAEKAVEGDHAYPQFVSVKKVLTHDLDLSIHEPYNELVNLLFTTAENRKDKAVLGAWREALNRDTEHETAQAAKKHIADNFITVVDMLEAFPSAKPGFAQLIEILPKQKPRLYSISSCSLVHANQIHVTIGVIQITTAAGRIKHGLCSNYLAGLNPDAGATVRLAVRTSKFRPPQNPKVPVVMVGPGTGLSPLIGFLQHREVMLKALHNAGSKQMNGSKTEQAPVKSGHARLYFGCHNLNDYLYQQELEGWREAGVLTQLDVAFSRLDDEKVYVQHLIGKQSKELWKVLSQPDCHYYVCGDAKMADEVFEVLMNIAKTTGGLTHSAAVEFFLKMKVENRFVMDVWGILHNFPEALADMQESRYSQGERWLKNVTPV